MCCIATLKNWYFWKGTEWRQVTLRELGNILRIALDALLSIALCSCGKNVYSSAVINLDYGFMHNQVCFVARSTKLSALQVRKLSARHS